MKAPQDRIKATARRSIDKMTPDEAKSAISEIAGKGIMNNPKLREITGGYSSQALQGYVQRYLGARAGLIRKENAR